MPDGVLHEILRQPFERDGVALGRRGRQRLVQDDALGADLLAGVDDDEGGDLGQFHGLMASQHGPVALGRREQAVDETLAPGVDDQQ
ncbi:hypothetical protein ACFYUV_43025 [Nonomuraea sp. NPDC003560]|uniref:hypothetical protein n=1 Tax=Nonomuraea sp. NPDC003560 TaxID=3364341 RepID=UPI0036917CC2